MARKAMRGQCGPLSGWVLKDVSDWVKAQAQIEGIPVGQIMERALMGERAKVERAEKRATESAQSAQS